MILIILFGLTSGFIFLMAGVFFQEGNGKATLGVIFLGFFCLFGMWIYSTLHEREYYQKNYPEIFEEEYRKDKILKLEKQIEVLKEDE